MAGDVRVYVTDAAIISALNTPGGAVYEWRNETMDQVHGIAQATSPVNDPMNAVHRGGVVGTFAASWHSSRYGNQHRLGFRTENLADHAVFVELGRSGSTAYQRFSWTGWFGEIGEVGGRFGGGTSARAGQHILRNAVNAVLPGATGGAYTPLA